MRDEKEERKKQARSNKQQGKACTCIYICMYKNAYNQQYETSPKSCSKDRYFLRYPKGESLLVHARSYYYIYLHVDGHERAVGKHCLHGTVKGGCSNATCTLSEDACLRYSSYCAAKVRILRTLTHKTLGQTDNDSYPWKVWIYNAYSTVCACVNRFNENLCCTWLANTRRDILRDRS